MGKCASGLEAVPDPAESYCGIRSWSGERSPGMADSGCSHREKPFPPLGYTQSDLIGQDLSVVVQAAFEEESRPVQG